MYSLRCKELGLTPPSLKLKCPIYTAKAHGIIAKAQKDLLRERIRNINNKLNDFDGEKTAVKNDLKSALNPEVQRHLATHIESKRLLNSTKQNVATGRKAYFRVSYRSQRLTDEEMGNQFFKIQTIQTAR